jgi:hypothetical protein
MGAADFRVQGKIFATLASQDEGYGNLKLTPEQQADFVRELPDVFLPIHGGWGRMGMTHIRLAKATEDVLAGALRTAWKLRVEKNTKKKKKKKSAPGVKCEAIKQLKERTPAPASRVCVDLLPGCQ